MTKTSKCIVCKKRNPTNIKCRCGETVCIMHRYADDHNCNFDYKANDIKQLEKENLLIIKNKVETI